MPVEIGSHQVREGTVEEGEGLLIALEELCVELDVVEPAYLVGLLAVEPAGERVEVPAGEPQLWSLLEEAQLELYGQGVYSHCHYYHCYCY